MNCPSRTDEADDEGHNQNPRMLSGDLTTRSDLGRIANARLQREHRLSGASVEEQDILQHPPEDTTNTAGMEATKEMASKAEQVTREPGTTATMRSRFAGRCQRLLPKILTVMRKYVKFIGPGFMISVAYIDPGNYATDVAAGASYRFKLLFIVLLSNVFAIFLQSLCINLGTVTGLNLSENIRAHCPPWLNYTSFVFGEAAIIATDMAEIIGTAMAIYMLSNGRVPLWAGCTLSVADVFFILFFYKQNFASMAARRTFEFFVAALVIGVVICFCIQLSYIDNATPGEVFRGYVPSAALVEAKALYQGCGILGATVMPHSLYLGSGLVQDRLRHFDKEHNLMTQAERDATDDDSLKQEPYRPSLQAIQACRWYSIVETAVSLFTFALFVNSAILIVSAAGLFGVKQAANASLFGIYDLLSNTIAVAVAKLFAVALLLSGISAGIVCTISGQIISEGQLQLKIKPWKRRLMIRSIAVTPALVVAGTLGKDGIGKALVGSQVVLSVLLPFISLPVIWFTCFGSYMKVTADRIRDPSVQRGVTEEGTENDDTHAIVVGDAPVAIDMRAHWLTRVFAVLIWGIIVVMNVSLLVLLAMGKT